MDITVSLFGVSIIFWSAILLYVIWIDRKIASLKKSITSLEDKG